MSEQRIIETPDGSQSDIRDVVRQTIQEFVQAEQSKAEPAYKAELQEERSRRESLEGRLNQLVEENRKARAMADEADRNSQIRSELQRLGVAKVELAFRAVKDDIVRTRRWAAASARTGRQDTAGLPHELRAGESRAFASPNRRWQRCAESEPEC